MSFDEDLASMQLKGIIISEDKKLDTITNQAPSHKKVNDVIGYMIFQEIPFTRVKPGTKDYTACMQVNEVFAVI